jgi:uncharacterized protein YciI
VVEREDGTVIVSPDRGLAGDRQPAGVGRCLVRGQPKGVRADELRRTVIPDGHSAFKVGRLLRRVQAGRGKYASAMANFAVRLVHGPGWDSSRQIRDQEAWDKHAAFMDGLVDDGFVILGGPVGDGGQTLHVVEAADENEVKVRLAGDPWASAGLLRVGTIEPWALWLDSRPANSAG